MNPKELIELMAVGFLIVTLAFITLFLKGKWRRAGWSLVLATLVTSCIFFIVRPYWIDTQISKRIEIIKPYLEQRYPNEKWVIQTVSHREKGYEIRNPNYISVVFDNETDVTYDYWIETKINIYTVAYSTKPGYYYELKHFIKKK